MHVKSLSPREKALQINLDPRTYGSFAEIGAGQEVAAFFFKAGGASGTIAKTISAYDMKFSDAIYGSEESGRYVCEPRLMKMLSKEYSLMEKRLKGVRQGESLFFAFANTMVALNFKKSNQGHGWVGIRFQLHQDAEPNDIVLHVNMHDTTTELQQQAAGIVGVNLIYAAFNYYETPELLINSLMEGLGRERIEIDMLRITGPDFKHIDNRLVSLLLVKNGLTNAALFDPQGNVLQPSETFYKKNIIVLRGRFRPTTKVNMDMLESGLEQFKNEPDVDQTKVIEVSELTLANLRSEGEIDDRDFLERVEILCSLGQTVMISNYHEYFRLVEYLSTMTKMKIGMILGVKSLQEIFNEEYYKNLKGGILESFSTLFSRNVKVYIYPTLNLETGEIVTTKNFHLSPKLIDLYEYLVVNEKLADITHVDQKMLGIVSDQVLKQIREGITGWEQNVPELVAKAIKEKQLFGYKIPIEK